MQIKLCLPLLLALVVRASAQAAGTAYGCDITKGGSKCCHKASDWANCPVCPSNAAASSQLYGCSGERFQPATSRLMDFSYAGYMYGNYEAPDMPVMANIKTTFGAKGDGVTDDTAAFEAAIHTIAISGTVWVPKGVYVITRRLDVDNQLFFRGEGAGNTILYFPRALQQVYGNTWANGISQYAFGPGWINFNGGDFPSASTTRVAVINGSALRGGNTVHVNSVDKVTVGEEYRVILDNKNGDLLYDLNAREMAPNDGFKNRVDVIRWTSKVTQVLKNPPRVVFERRLPFNVSTAWAPELHLWVSLDYGFKRNFTGMSDMTIRFPNHAWSGENKDAGYNGIYMFHTSHSYIKNIVFENTDLGIAMDGCHFNTVQNVTFNTNRDTSNTNGLSGNKGIWLKGTTDCLVKDFKFNAKMLHELAISYFAMGNVFANGMGADLTMELMYGAAYSNLFTNINVGAGTNPFGWVVRGQDAAAYNTFWNIRRWGGLTLPPWTWAPRANFINMNDAAQPFNTSGWWLETKYGMWPYNLHDAQRSARGRPLAPARPPVHAKGPGYGCTPAGAVCCFNTGTCPNCPADYKTPSSLFGCQGELWKAQGRLAWDWGYAGYRQGQAPPVGKLPVTANVKTQFGAKGDGVTDDTNAVLKALDAVQKGVLYFPAGTYILKSVFNIRKPIVLRGDGKGKTILMFPKSLTDLYGNTWVEGGWVGTSQYSHGTGFINFGGWDPTGRDFTKITDVTKASAVGDRTLYVASTANIAVGQWVRMYQSDPGDGSLMQYLNGNLKIADWLKGYSDPCRFLSKVVAKGPNWIKLERPVPYPMRLNWTPQIHKFMPMIDDTCGVESLTMSFTFKPYPGHFLEQGWNGIHLNQVVNGWVKDVEVLNSDMAVYLWGTVWTTVDGLVVNNKGGSRGWYNGHRGIWLEHGQENLYTGFNQAVRFVHDISVSGTEQGSVIMSGQGQDLNLDHHRSSPYFNLFTSLNLGWGSRVFEASGDTERGSHGAMSETFWSLPAKLNYLSPKPEFAPLMNMVALPINDLGTSPYNWWSEVLPRPYPTNLYWWLRSSRARRVPA